MKILLFVIFISLSDIRQSRMLVMSIHQEAGQTRSTISLVLILLHTFTSPTQIMSTGETGDSSAGSM